MQMSVLRSEYVRPILSLYYLNEAQFSPWIQDARAEGFLVGIEGRGRHGLLFGREDLLFLFVYFTLEVNARGRSHTLKIYPNLLSSMIDHA